MTGYDLLFAGPKRKAIKQPRKPATKRNEIDAKSVRLLFDYRDGQLFWKLDMGYRTKRGDRAGTLKKTGYRSIQIYGKAYQEHRLVYLWHAGKLPDYIDHINGDKSDNRIENLRASDSTLNQANRKASGGASQYKGVYRSKARWRAAIQIDGKTEVIGYFETEEAAALAYNARAKSAFGEHAKLNVVPTTTTPPV